MYFKRFELTEFFGTEKLCDDEIEDFYLTYFIQLEHGFSVELFLVSYEDTAIITLNHKDLNVISDIRLKGVASITCDQEFLYFYKENRMAEDKQLKPFLIIRVKPHFSCSFVDTGSGIKPDILDINRE